MIFSDSSESRQHAPCLKRGIRSYLHGEGILLEAYSPLSALLSHCDYPLTQAIGKAHNVSSVQVALKASLLRFLFILRIFAPVFLR